MLSLTLLTVCSCTPKWTTYGMENGLEGKEVYAIASDMDGGIWLGTSGGISFYDGATWTFYAIAPQSSVDAITIGPKGDVWLEIGGSHIANFDKETHEIKNYFTLSNTVGPPINGIIRSIAVDHDENVWIGTTHYEVVGDSGHEYFGGGIFRMDAGKVTYIEDLPPHADINSISVASDGAVWISTNDSVYKYDGEQWKSVVTPSGVGGLSVIAPDGTLWLGTWEAGVYHYDGEAWKSYAFDDINYITCISVAANGDVWVGTRGNGISRFNGYRWRTYAIPDKLTDDNEATAIHVTPDGSIWVGTNNGITRYKP
jgi:ligand-binding sensor domain-containing protein